MRPISMSSSRVLVVAILGACLLDASAAPHRTLPTRSADPPRARVDPYAGTPCPGDLSLALKRTIDGREPNDTQPGPYAKEHQHEITADQLLARDAAIAKILALEARTPAVVPAELRAGLADRARDPDYRLFMARCELGSASTLRRAGYDAALAYLLGASESDALPIVMQSLEPDGSIERTQHTSLKSCNEACDAPRPLGNPNQDSCRTRCMLYCK